MTSRYLSLDELRHMTPVFMYYTLIDKEGQFVLCGMKSSKDGYIHRHDGFNSFLRKLTKIPDNARLDNTPSNDWIKSFFYDETKTRFCFETLKLETPPNAHGNKYEIVFNGGVPYVVYINDDGIFVYRVPNNKYMDVSDYDNPSYLENKDIIYTELVWSCANPMKIFIGEDKCVKKHGNNILVQVQETLYMHIGCQIYMFESHDQITEFYSRMGNSSVPYPVALTEDCAIFMDDKDRVKKDDLISFGNVPIENEVIQWDDAYGAYYDIKRCNPSLITRIEMVYPYLPLR